jgi:hypothetical protein
MFQSALRYRGRKKEEARSKEDYIPLLNECLLYHETSCITKPSRFSSILRVSLIHSADLLKFLKIALVLLVTKQRREEKSLLELYLN